MQRYKAALFDLDGVLVDTTKYHYQAWKVIAEELGFTFTEIQNERLKGVSRMQSLDILLSIGGLELDAKQKEEIAKKKNAIYVDYIAQLDDKALLPGAKAFLENLREKGIHVVLGSASKNATLILENTGIKPLFDAIIDGTQTTKAKPDPEVFTRGAEGVGVSYDECIVFEDSVAGIEAAKAVGMKTVGIGDKNNLYMADCVIKGLDEASAELFVINI